MRARRWREDRRKRDGDWSHKTEGEAQNRDEKTRERCDWPKRGGEAAGDGGRKVDWLETYGTKHLN